MFVIDQRNATVRKYIAIDDGYLNPEDGGSCALCKNCKRFAGIFFCLCGSAYSMQLEGAVSFFLHLSSFISQSTVHL